MIDDLEALGTAVGPLIFELWWLCSGLTVFSHIASKIRDAYAFIAQNFEEGDEIFLFG